MKKFLATTAMLAAVFVGGTAFGDTVFNKPADPAWMSVPCSAPWLSPAAPDHRRDNCWFDPMQQGYGEGPPAYFERYLGSQHIRCYFYFNPKAAAQIGEFDHCNGDAIKPKFDYSR